MKDALLAKKAKKVRKDCLTYVWKAKSSHIGSMLSVVDILTYLIYEKIKNGDKVILSKGHASLALYSILADKKIISAEELKSYCQNGSRLIGHLSHKVPGVDVSTGSLGHGLSMAAGIALANKMDNRKNWVYCLIGDGECQEGAVWEAFVFIARHKLKKLVVIVDANKLQGYDFCNKLFPEKKLISMLKATGLNFYEVNGHDFSELRRVFKRVEKNSSEKASIIFAHTIKGKGVSFMENRLEWHYKSPDDKQLEIALKELK
ncbi:MAG: transketolase [Candidatus Woesearchaeota archaeon]